MFAIEAELPASCAGPVRVLLDPEDGTCVCAATSADFLPAPEEFIELTPTATICRADSVDLAAISTRVEVVTDAVWSTSGDGDFVPGNNFSTALFYRPGPQDGRTGEVTLTLTSIPATGCEAVSDEIVIEVLNVDCGEFPWGGGN